MGYSRQYLEGLRQYDVRPRKPVVVENYLQSEQYRKKLVFENQLLQERVQAARADVEHTNLMHGSSLTSDSGPYVSQQLAYGNVVRRTYPNAATAENFGLRVQSYIQSVSAVHTASNVLFAASICSDDVNGPVFNNINNLGQMPQSLQSFLGPFMAGGLDGYPHTGTTGLFAYASHVTQNTNGALFIYVAPHIGITRDGQVGYMRRRGQGYGDLSATCGAAAAAASWVSTSNVAPTFPNPDDLLLSNPSDYQFFTLVDAIWSNVTARNAIKATSDFGQQMILATEAIRNAAYNIITASVGGTSTFSLAYDSCFTGAFKPDVYLSSGTFINVDDGYKAYVDVNNFMKYNNSTGNFTDYTTQFKAGLQLN